MEVITADNIRELLRPYLRSLPAKDLVVIRKSLKNASKIEDIPAPVRTVLRLREFLLVRNLHEAVFHEFDKLLPERCSIGNLRSKEDKECVKNYLEKYQTDLKTSLKDGGLNGLEITTENSSDNILSIIEHYCKHLVETKIALWQQRSIVTARLLEENSKLVLLIQLPIIILSQVKKHIEEWLEMFPGQISQIKLVAQQIFLVDCSLDNSKWHGMDVVIIARKLECIPGKHLWDLKGKDGATHIPEKAENGRNGLHGVSGEDGGNLIVISKEFCGLEHLKVTADAGSGGNGQHGGDGIDAEDGIGMNYEQMMRLFSSSVVSSEGVKKLVFENAINFMAQREQLLFSPESAFDETTGKVTGNIDECFMEGVSKDGLKLYLSFRTNLFHKSAICLVQGTPGSQSQGGTGRLGGASSKAGVPGKVHFSTFDEPEKQLNIEDIGVQVSCKNGKTGSSGANGVNGKSGNPGKDVAYMALSAKDVIELTAGKYQLIIEDSQTDKNSSVRSKLLGKFLKIGAAISSPNNVIKNGKLTEEIGSNLDKLLVENNESSLLTTKPILPDAKSLIEEHGHLIWSNSFDGLVCGHDGKWWNNAIVELS